MSLTPGEGLGPYKILSLLGKGGMGEVYLAEDTRLRRRVAVKVLPSELLEDPDRRKRFLREARAAAAVDHPNIVHIYEVQEEPSGRIYLVMQHVEGRTLREILKAEKLALDKALAVASEVADALSAAHSKGVVHRDIKPDNIMVDEAGHARILDFGLARALEGDLMAGSVSEIETMTQAITGEGRVMGTAAYMSPEQARGDIVDARSDIFSLGITLYEMVARRHPFAGRTGVETVDALLHNDPKPVAELTPGMPLEVDWVLTKALAKDRDERYQSAKELVADLRRIQRSSSGSGSVSAAREKPKRGMKRSAAVFGVFALLVVASILLLYLFRERMGPSPEPPPAVAAGAAAPPVAGTAPAAMPAKIQLAVLPFEIVRKDDRIDFLGFALADALISKLSYLDSVTVRPSSFVQKYRDAPPEDPKQVGEDLGVNHLLTGSLLAQGDALRVSVQLVNLEAGTVAWQDTVDAKLDDLLSVQDDVVSRIVDGMKLNISAEEQALLARDRPRDAKAFGLYLRSVSQPRSPEGTRVALQLLRDSLELDDQYAPSWEALAGREYDKGVMLDGEVDYAAVEKDVLHALELNPDFTPAWQTLSVVYTETNRHEELYPKIKSWIARRPDAGPAYFSLSYLFRYAGLLDEAAVAAERALALEPGNPEFRSGGMVYLYLFQQDKAMKFFNLDEGSIFYWHAVLAMKDQQVDSASVVETIDHVLTMRLDSGERQYLEGWRLVRLGRREEGRRAMERIASRAPEDGEARYSVAANMVFAGSEQPALDLIEKAVRSGFYCYPFMSKDPRLDPLRSDPRLQAILETARARHEAFKAFVASNP